MNNQNVANRIDSVIRFFLYLLIFWLPYSSAVIESCVIASLILWIIKRVILYDWKTSRDLTIRDKIRGLAKAFRPKSNFLNTPILWFLLICILSVISSAFFEHALRGFITKTLEWFVIYFLVIEVFTLKRHILIALAVFLFSSFAVCLDSIIQFYLTGKDIFSGRMITRGGATAAFKHANSLGGYLTIVIPVIISCIYFFKNRKSAYILFSIYLYIALWSAVISLSRGAWIGIVSGIFLFLFIINRKTLILWMTFIFLTFALCFFVFSSQNIKHHFRVDSKNFHRTMQWRKGLWTDSLEMVKDKPIFGHGLNMYMNLFQEYRRKTDSGFDYSPTYAHNCYIQMASEIGLLGLICFLWIIGRFFKKIIHAIKKYYISDNSDLKIMLNGLLAGAFAFLVHSFFDTNLYSLQLSSLFWFMTGITASLFILLK